MIKITGAYHEVLDYAIAMSDELVLDGISIAYTQEYLLEDERKPFVSIIKPCSGLETLKSAVVHFSQSLQESANYSYLYIYTDEREENMSSFVGWFFNNKERLRFDQLVMMYQ